MKFAKSSVCFASIALIAGFCLTGFCLAKDSDSTRSVLETSEPILIDHGPVVVNSYQDSVVDDPSIEPGTILSVPEDDLQWTPITPPPPVLAESPVVVQRPIDAPLPLVVCQECHCETCCCKHRCTSKCKVETTFCLVDTDGCTHEVCVRVPACCVNEAPSITWKKRRLLGRQIATLCWDCCGHEVRVIITRRGKIRVRD